MKGLPTTKTPPYCKGCRYRRPVSTHKTDTACHYLYDTGRRRECDPKAFDPPRCDKYRKRKRGQRAPGWHPNEFF